MYMKGSKLVHINFPILTLKVLDKIAKEQGENRSTIIRKAVHSYIENGGKNGRDKSTKTRVKSN